MIKKIMVWAGFSILIAGSSFGQAAETAEMISPLGVGKIIPDVGLMNLLEEKVSTLKEITKPSVLVFYRGGWCPYCNKQLSGLAIIEKDIQAMGYTLIAVSPDAPAQLKATMDKNKLSYTLLSDRNGELIRAMGLAFKAPEKYGSMLLKASGGGNTETVLPVPAVYITDKNGKILYKYSDPDYSKRLDEQELLKVLKQNMVNK